MNEENIKQNSLQAWILASRPKTLTAASVPVMIAVAMAWKTHINTGTSFSVVACVLCFLFAFIMQIDANFVNDYFDCVRGNDDATRLGPKRACAMGWVSLRAMRIALAITTIIACIIGTPLMLFGGWEMICVGIACVLFCFLYTTCLSYWGLGDLLVLVFFGIVPVCCSWYVILPSYDVTFDFKVFAMSIAVGLVIDTLLIINNYRDIDNDRRAGKRTLAVFMGRDKTLLLYACVVPVAICINLLIYPCMLMYAAMFIVFVLHINTYQQMKHIQKGRELNVVLSKTALNIFVYGILSTLCVIFM